MSQARVEPAMDETELFQIMQQYPAVRIAGFAFLERSLNVMFSESGYAKFTHIHFVDSAKNEGNHWMVTADVLQSSHYSAFDTRCGEYGRTNYYFPFSETWEKDEFYFEEQGKCFVIRPKVKRFKTAKLSKRRMRKLPFHLAGWKKSEQHILNPHEWENQD